MVDAANAAAVHRAGAYSGGTAKLWLPRFPSTSNSRDTKKIPQMGPCSSSLVSALRQPPNAVVVLHILEHGHGPFVASLYIDLTTTESESSQLLMPLIVPPSLPCIFSSPRNSQSVYQCSTATTGTFRGTSFRLLDLLVLSVRWWPAYHAH